MILKTSLRAKAGIPKTLLNKNFAYIPFISLRTRVIMLTESHGEFSDLQSIFRLRALRYWIVRTLNEATSVVNILA